MTDELQQILCDLIERHGRELVFDFRSEGILIFAPKGAQQIRVEVEKNQTSPERAKQ